MSRSKQARKIRLNPILLKDTIPFEASKKLDWTQNHINVTVSSFEASELEWLRTLI